MQKAGKSLDLRHWESTGTTAPLQKGETQTVGQTPFEGLIRCREAARLLGMSEWLLRKLAHEGQLAYIQRTRTSPLLFDPADLRKWVEREKIRG
jgi:hypothetical protein